MNFAIRSNQKEIIDREDLSFESVRKNMKELDFINRWLGGHRISLDGFRELSRMLPLAKNKLKVCEIGCGGGDNLRMLKQWCQREGLELSLTGIDINPHCIAYARSLPENAGIEFIENDYKTLQFDEKPDILFSSLFCHHFTDTELIYMIHWMKANAASGFFINDLHRHPIAYHSIKWLTTIFSGSELVKNDAPLSVRRGFLKKEWEALLHAGEISGYRIQWKWAFRWLVIAKNIGIEDAG